LKTKEKGKEILHLDPWTSISFSPWVLGGTESRGGPDGAVSGEVRPRRRGGIGGGARERREEPRDGLGWGWGGRSGRCHGEQRPAVAGSGGGGGPAGLSGGEWVGEHRWRARKVAAGVVGHEKGRRRELRRSLGGGGGHGGGGGRSRLKGACGAGLSSSGGVKEGRGRL